MNDNYLFRKGNGNYQSMSDLFDGVKVLKSDGFFSIGKPKNIYFESWVNSASDDFAIDYDHDQDVKITRDNAQIEISFIVSDKYASTTIDVDAVYSSMCSYYLGRDIYIRSTAANKDVRAVSLDNQSTSRVRLKRNNNNYILASWKFHALMRPYISTDVSWFTLDVSRLDVDVLQ